MSPQKDLDSLRSLMAPWSDCSINLSNAIDNCTTLHANMLLFEESQSGHICDSLQALVVCRPAPFKKPYLVQNTSKINDSASCSQMLNHFLSVH